METNNMIKPKIRKITGIIALNVAAMLLGVVCGGFLHSRADKGIEILTEVTEDQGGAMINEGKSNKAKLTGRKLSPSEYPANSVSPQAESAYMLNASVYPEDAMNKVDWTVAFTNADSAWAVGKQVTDYVVVRTASDGALTAILENKAAFGEQITVNATSRENPDVYATCHVEYLQRTTGYEFALHGNFHYEVSSLKTSASIMPDFIVKPQAGVYITVDKSTVYTRANDDKVMYYTIKPTEAFKTAITNAGLSASALIEYSGDPGGQSSIEFFGPAWGKAVYGSSAANRNKLINVICDFHANAYEVTLWSENGGIELAKFYMYFDASKVIGQKLAERIEIDETEIVL